VARVNWKVLRLSDVREAVGAEASSQAKEQYIESWIDRQLWRKEARKHVRLTSSMREQVREYRRELRIREYCDRRIRAGIHISENDVLRYYSGHREDFVTPVAAVSAELYACDNMEAAAEALRTLKNGDIPPVPPDRRLLRSGDCVPVIEKALFSGSSRGLLGPVSAGGHYYVIAVRERYEKDSLLKVEHVRDEIIQKLKIRAYLNAYQQQLKELKERSNVKIFQIPD
jgi:hypothetical protein